MTREIVFVTGGGGYIGSSVVHAFLQHPAGYIVRLGLRKTSQRDAYLEKYKETADRLQFYLFDDMTTEGVFDRALEGVSYVAHLASSTNFEPEDNVRDVMQPGIMGMKNMLRAASLNSSVKGIAYTSGISAYYDCHDQGSPHDHFDATSFNPRTWEETAALPRSRGVEVYNNTKVLVERMAWKYMEDHKPHFWLTTVGPMWVLGPSEVPLAVDAVDVGSAFELTYRHLLDTQVQQVEDLPYFVDIRDVADAHVICATDPRAAGKRYILSGGRYSYYAIARILQENYPEHSERICQYPAKEHAPTWTADTSDFEEDVGFQWRSLETCVKDWGRQVLAMPKPTKAGRSDYTAQLDDRVYQPV